MEGNCAPQWTHKQPHLSSTTHVAQTDNWLIHGSRKGHPIKLSWWMKPAGAHVNVIIILGKSGPRTYWTHQTPSLGPHTLVNTLHYDGSSPTNLPSYILYVSQANRQRIPNCPWGVCSAQLQLLTLPSSHQLLLLLIFSDPRYPTPFFCSAAEFNSASSLSALWPTASASLWVVWVLSVVSWQYRLFTFLSTYFLNLQKLFILL